MLLRTSSLALIVFFVAACSNPASGPELSSEAQTDEFLALCPLSVRPVNADGSVQAFQIVGPEHVASFHGDRAHTEGELAVFVLLNEEGNRRMLRFTEGHVGDKVAVFCGDHETSRPEILEPFSSPFRVVIADERSPN